MAVVPLDDIWVTANFKETQLSRMKPGQRVRFSVDAYGQEYKGKIVAVGGASGSRFSVLPPENATGNYVKVVQRIPVRINLDPGTERRSPPAPRHVGGSQSLSANRERSWLTLPQSSGNRNSIPG